MRTFFVNLKKKAMIDNISLAAEIRELTGISKRELAKWFDMDQSALSKSNLGHRGIPLHAGSLEVDMHAAMRKLVINEVPAMDTVNKDKILNHAIQCRRRYTLLQFKLDKMKHAYKQAVTRLALMETNPPNRHLPEPVRQNWIESQCYYAKKIMEDTGWYAQTQITIRMAVLEREAELYEAAANTIINQ